MPTYHQTGVVSTDVVADPGTGAAIPVTNSANISLTMGAGAETNTLAVPSFRGQELVITVAVDGGGTRAITSAQALNTAGNTVMTFGEATDAIKLEAVQIGANLRWRIAWNDGVALS